MSNKYKDFKLCVELFDYDIWVYIWDKEWYKKIILQKHKEDLWVITYDWLCYHNNTRESIIGIFEYKNKKELRSIIIHELSHAIQQMLLFMWIGMDYDNTELVSNIWEFCLPKILDNYNL